MKLDQYQHFSTLSTRELERIIEYQDQYELGAVNAAIVELNVRGIPIKTANPFISNEKPFIKTNPDALTAWYQQIIRNYHSIDKKAKTLAIVISVISTFFYLYILTYSYKKPIIWIIGFIRAEVLNVPSTLDVFCLVIFPIGIFQFLQGKRIGWLILTFFWSQTVINNIYDIFYSNLQYIEVLIFALIIQVFLILWHTLIIVLLSISRITNGYKIKPYIVFFTFVISILVFFAANSN